MICCGATAGPEIVLFAAASPKVTRWPSVNAPEFQFPPVDLSHVELELPVHVFAAPCASTTRSMAVAAVLFTRPAKKPAGRVPSRMLPNWLFESGLPV